MVRVSLQLVHGRDRRFALSRAQSALSDMPPDAMSRVTCAAAATSRLPWTSGMCMSSKIRAPTGPWPLNWGSLPAPWPLRECSCPVQTQTTKYIVSVPRVPGASAARGVSATAGAAASRPWRRDLLRRSRAQNHPAQRKRPPSRLPLLPPRLRCLRWRLGCRSVVRGSLTHGR